MPEGEIDIREEGPENYAAHGADIPIGFWVRSRIDVEALLNGEISELPCDLVFKDYDVFEEERPGNLPNRFDVGGWVLLAAYRKGRRIGGAILAKGSGYPLNEGRNDLAAIIDIRVHPDERGKGVGGKLIQHARDWAARNAIQEIRIETQDTNVAACRFYKSLGCQVHTVEEGAYLPVLDEARIVWSIRVFTP